MRNHFVYTTMAGSCVHAWIHSFIHLFILLLVLWFGSGRGLVPDRQLMSCRDQSKI